MLVPIHKSVRECLERAADAHNRAQMTADPNYREFLLRMEEQWIRMARQAEMAVNLEKFAKSRSPR